VTSQIFIWSYWKIMKRFSKFSWLVFPKVGLVLGLATAILYLTGSFLPSYAESAPETDIQPIEQVLETPTPTENQTIKEPDAGIQPTTRPAARTGSAQATAKPVGDPNIWSYITIAGKVSAPIMAVGLDSSGAVAVPAAAVGLWRISPDAPHFLDGHNDGVFSELYRVALGDIIDIVGDDGLTISFRVYDIKIYEYNHADPRTVIDNQLTGNGRIMSDALYNGGAAGLNLMTCHGQPVAGTYSHRLVVFAK
jgi:hypothetical protein